MTAEDRPPKRFSPVNWRANSNALSSLRVASKSWTQFVSPYEWLRAVMPYALEAQAQHRR
eukprot:CAMPEP_0174336930 /NCGR_PEP_ID=MMETSP0810-20121108/21910_1 /TAXON_ID=73025 ORGANISM="Eutreptiella gymnastica-like, Strain CCMP1594" /NCGR_SAMPLE_ID=MMETSP0810 /ASSEMBLY_ACC=CAM_ASM_000659 /LENGTH=59 /DNA_ID=CAMNT_0015456071 /DNA_START=96 /DNA_END=271 /DNA_ORIENTATION=-